MEEGAPLPYPSVHVEPPIGGFHVPVGSLRTEEEEEEEVAQKGNYSGISLR